MPMPEPEVILADVLAAAARARQTLDGPWADMTLPEGRVAAAMLLLALFEGDAKRACLAVELCLKARDLLVASGHLIVKEGKK